MLSSRMKNNGVFLFPRMPGTWYCEFCILYPSISWPKRIFHFCGLTLIIWCFRQRKNYKGTFCSAGNLKKKPNDVNLNTSLPFHSCIEHNRGHLHNLAFVLVASHPVNVDFLGVYFDNLEINRIMTERRLASFLLFDLHVAVHVKWYCWWQ